MIWAYTTALISSAAYTVHIVCMRVSVFMATLTYCKVEDATKPRVVFFQAVLKVHGQAVAFSTCSTERACSGERKLCVCARMCVCVYSVTLPVLPTAHCSVSSLSNLNSHTGRWDNSIGREHLI